MGIRPQSMVILPEDDLSVSGISCGIVKNQSDYIYQRAIVMHGMYPLCRSGQFLSKIVKRGKVSRYFRRDVRGVLQKKDYKVRCDCKKNIHEIG